MMAAILKKETSFQMLIVEVETRRKVQILQNSDMHWKNGILTPTNEHQVRSINLCTMHSAVLCTGENVIESVISLSMKRNLIFVWANWKCVCSPSPCLCERTKWACAYMAIYVHQFHNPSMWSTQILSSWLLHVVWRQHNTTQTTLRTSNHVSAG